MSIDTQIVSNRLSPRREVGFVAVAVSVVAHIAIGLALAALWVPPELLSSAKRREVVPTDVDVLDESTPDEAIADVAEKDEESAQGPHGAVSPPVAPLTQPEKPSPPPPPSPVAPPPEPKAPTDIESPAPRASARPRAAASTSASASASAASSAPAGDPDGGGGAKRPELPSVMARFTHDLADWSSGVPAWQTVPIGDAGSIVVSIAVDDDGKIDKQHDPFDGAADKLPPALVESVKRTKSALVTKMGSRNVLVRLKVGAVVSDVDAPEGQTLKLSFDHYDPKTKKGGSTFVLGSGRRVSFSVEVLETRALTDTP